ncbi:MAG TPA: FIST N-terminal domain-containing protein [Pyrinomonadaceae bacterium]|nr:FIST N-terminal domain-containing protein [Pyrinomonadaceae bacterium]
MLSYLAFIHHGIASASDPFTDGKFLASKCLQKLRRLDDEKQFPPSLLILLASPAYLESVKAEQLLSGVFHVFDQAGHDIPPLMGCSVAAVFFDKHIYHDGALLVCIASRLLTAKVGVSQDLKSDAHKIDKIDEIIEKAVKSLLNELDLLTNDDRPVNSLGNLSVFTFLPGFGRYGYIAPKLHKSLRDHLGAGMPIFGGAASANDPERARSGLVFANRGVHRNAIVAASVKCGTPFGLSLTQGLEESDKTYTVAAVSARDKRVITQFREGTAAKIWSEINHSFPVPLLANLELDGNRIIDLAAFNGESITMAREAKEDQLFRVMIPNPEKMQRAFREGVERSLTKAWLLNPIGGLGFRCAGLLRQSKRLGLDLKQETAEIEHDLSIRDSADEKPFVGGFLDGEASVDETGKSVLSNWSNATLAFGDELRFRTPVYLGFEKIAMFAAKKAADTCEEGVDRLTDLIYQIGFPGAILSLWQRDDEHDAVVAQSASGSRFAKVLKLVEPYLVDEDDIIAVVAREKQARTIINTSAIPCGSMKAASENGIVSQHIVPLEDDFGQVHAVLQIGLGDISYDTRLYPSEKSVLGSLQDIVKSGLNRTFSRERYRIIRSLDHAMSACLSAETSKKGLQQYLEMVLPDFGLADAFIYIANRDRSRLSLVAGTGKCYEEMRKANVQVDSVDQMPIAQAFRNENPIIINEASLHQGYQQMCDRWKSKPSLWRSLLEVGSVANMPFESQRRESESEQTERGTITLASPNKWFFKAYHERAMKALSERVGFLLETLRRKEQESFLLGVTPQFSKIRHPDNVREVLEREVTRFAKAAQAEVTSLYRWHNNRERFILAAQKGWNDPGWVNVAYYTDKEQWVGSSALGGMPCHIPDLDAFYAKNPACEKRYKKAALGPNPPAGFTMEAITLELKAIGYRLGVLTLYRRIKKGAESGFFTTEPELLQRGADRLAALIAILEAYRLETWRAREHERREKIHAATVAAAPKNFEVRVCKEVIESFSARKARFYKIEGLEDTEVRCELKAALERDAETDRVEAGQRPPAEDELVWDVIRLNRRQRKALIMVPVTVDPRDCNPHRAALANCIERVCIPLVSEDKLVGILDMHWSFDHGPVDSLADEHSENHLLVLGRIIGSAYRRTQAKISLKRSEEKRDRSSLAVQVTSAYVLQHQHELVKIVQNMIGLLESLDEAFKKGEAQEQELIIQKLSQRCADSSDELARLVDIGRRVVAQIDEDILVSNVIRAALAKRESLCASLQIKVRTSEIDENAHVYADSALVEIVITNLLDNAISSMVIREERDPRELTISAATNADGQTVTIVIKDTGIGMTQGELDQMPEGFFQRENRISLGVPINRIILAIYGSTIEYESVPERGTEARIVFPINYRE